MNAVASPERRAEPGIAGTAPRGHSWSLRGRLMWLAGIATMVAWLTGGTAVLIAAYQESEELYDERLRDVAGVILSFAGHEIEEIRAEGRTGPIHQETATTLDRRYAYQIWSASGELLLMSHNAPRAPFAPLSHTGLLDNSINGKPHCVFALRSADGTMVIQVAEDESLREAFVLNVNAWLAAFLVLTTGLLLLLNRWLFGNATRALDQSARQLVDRSANDLRPIQADDPPSELIPLLDSINTLFRRFEHTLRRTGLSVRFREKMERIERIDDGFVVKTSRGSYRTGAVLLAIGRRGTPRKLGVPGEERPKVVYRLVDPEQYRGMHVLVVGGGDSALEAAVALGEQPGCHVTLSYRSEAFSRVKPANRARLDALQQSGAVRVLLKSSVTAIGTDDVALDHAGESVRLRNDAVIVCAGGELPFELLKRVGVAFRTHRGEPVAR